MILVALDFFMMIKRTFDRLTWFSLVAILSFYIWLGLEQKSFALPTEQILKTLQPVPVYTITDNQGSPLFTIEPDNKNRKITPIFLDHNDANNFFLGIQKQNPDLVTQAKVHLVSLAEVFRISQLDQEKNNGFRFYYVPQEQQVKEAKKYTMDDGKPYTKGVPLFVARGIENLGFISVQDNGESLVPMFFDLTELEHLLDRLKKEKPEIANNLKIEVVPLEDLINTMRVKDDELLSKIVVIPSAESVKVAQSFPSESAVSVSKSDK